MSAMSSRQFETLSLLVNYYYTSIHALRMTRALFLSLNVKIILSLCADARILRRGRLMKSHLIYKMVELVPVKVLSTHYNMHSR